MKKEPDIVIIGGGNAALCAAITARKSGASVVILESAPFEYRGGNSRHTRNFRCMHDNPVSVLTDSYQEQEYYEDLLTVTGGKTNPELARLTITESANCLAWMQEHGARFQPAISGTLSLSRTNAFFLGGGKALLNAYYRTTESLGVQIIYNAPVQSVMLEGQRASAVTYLTGDTETSESVTLKPKAVIVASGGFQADLDWLARAWGPAARNFLIRGTPYNRGVVLKNLLDQGLESVGDPTQCHAVAIDGRSPRYDGGIVTRLDCVVYSIVVNKLGERFYDEGEDVWPKRYAIWGRLVAAQPDQIAYSIIDSKSLALFMPSVFPPLVADTIAELAEKMGLPVAAVERSISNFNNACGDDADFKPTELDGLKTDGLSPAKTNWARPIDTPPYYGYSLRPGVTFTYLGLAVDAQAKTRNTNGPLENIWAAGETMAGSILGQGYLAGFGMTIGTVFGRIAGQEAAKYVK